MRRGAEASMNEQQFRQVRENARAKGPLLLGQARPNARCGKTPLATVLAQAAQKLYRRQAGETAWVRVAQPAWLAETTVADVDGDVLVIATTSSTMCYELRRQQVVLERQIARLTPGVHRLRFEVAGRAATETEGKT